MSDETHRRTVNESVVRYMIRDLADPASIDLAASLIADRLVGPQDLPEIEAVILQARQEFAPLFLGGSRGTQAAPTTAASSPTAPSTYKGRQAQHESDTLEAVLTRAGGNPYRTGNATAIVLVEARDPTRAARLKAEAGK